MRFERYGHVETLTKGLIIFDRDGTLIEDTKGLSNPEMIKWLPSRLDVLSEITALGYTLAIATNQGAVEEGIISEQDLLNLHSSFVSQAQNEGIAIWSIIYCPHGRNLTGRFCRCRKPRPGMIQKLLSEISMPNLKTSLFGNKETDLQAATSSGLSIDAFLVNNENFKEKVIRWAKEK
jgi:D-glycero-D-manno-heptose 1,7-bisphosphate phosphatase